MPCIDIIVVKQLDGSVKSSPFFIHFHHSPHTSALVDIEVNGRLIQLQDDIRLKLAKGEHFAMFQKRVVQEVPVISDSTKDQQYEHHTFRQKMHHLKDVVTSPRSKVKTHWLRVIDAQAKKLGEEFTTPPQQLLQFLDASREINTIRFIHGKESVCGRVFIWDTSTRIVVSDIDGTITRSDVKGQIATKWLGKQYAHPGVASLFNTIHSKGYKLMYLTVRSIAKHDFTIKYIEQLKQGETALPPGPVITPPVTGHAIMRWRMPTEFKIPALKHVVDLFPPDVNPFVAGWGNRPTDTMSYIAIGINPCKIWIVNKQGKVISPDCRDELTHQIKHWASYENLAETYDTLQLAQVEAQIQQKVVADINNVQQLEKLQEQVKHSSSSKLSNIQDEAASCDSCGDCNQCQGGLCDLHSRDRPSTVA